MKGDKRNPILRVVPRPGDINANGHIFGGWELSQMDIAAGIVASRAAEGAVATVAITRWIGIGLPDSLRERRAASTAPNAAKPIHFIILLYRSQARWLRSRSRGSGCVGIGSCRGMRRMWRAAIAPSTP